MTLKQDKVRNQILSKAHIAHGKELNAYATFKLDDRALGTDLVQETFTKTWSYLIRGGKIEIMKAFLYHVLNNLIVDEYRKHKTTSLDVLSEKGFEPNGEDPNRFIDFLDGKAALLLIQRLPEKYQKVMRMKYTQHLSLKEMSLITGQTKNTMAVQAHRGLEKLKSLYSSNSVSLETEDAFAKHLV